MSKKRWLFPLLCYAAALVVYLALCAVALAADRARSAGGSMPTETLGLESFELEGVIPVEAGGETEWFVSGFSDPQMVYEPQAPFYVRDVLFAGYSNHPGGEIVLYYTTRPGEEFDENKKVWAFWEGEGLWRFDLGGRRVYGLRLDPDTAPDGLLWAMQGVTLNAPRPAWRYFVPDAWQAVLLALLPGVACAAGLETARSLLPALEKWRRRRRPAAGRQ